MKSFAEDIRHSFLPRYGAVAQILLVNMGIFLGLGFIGTFFFLMGQWGTFKDLFQYLTLPAELGQLLFQPWTLLSYAFVHFPLDVLHIVFNMLALFWFGMIFRMYIGNQHVWPTFIAGSLGGAVVFLLAYNVFPVFNTAVNGTFLRGASAGVNAIIVATAMAAPNYVMYLMFFGPVRIKWIALVYVLLDVVFVASSNSGGHIAHLGGALMGYIYFSALQNGHDGSAPFSALAGVFRRRSSKSRSNLRVVYQQTAPSSSNPTGKPTQSEIDRILDKIKAVGYEKLTQEEKQTLLRASQ
jgi:membrane associated rhomboid family serine protease